jgi:hypothetical protein
MNKPHRYLALFISPLIALFLLVHVANAMRWQWSLPGAYYGEIPGSVYKEFEFPRNNVGACQFACERDERCRAYTYIIPRGNGNGICFLKQECHLKNDKIQVPPEAGAKVPGKLGAFSNYKAYFCPKLSLATKSPLPGAVIGGHYNFQLNASGIEPLKYCPMKTDPRGGPPRCDNSYGQSFSMPHGLKLSKTGLISGQVKCGPDMTKCQENYVPVLIQVKDSCPNNPQTTIGEFWIQIKKQPIE